MQDRLVFNTQNLVLQVNPTYNPTTLRLGDWERYLDILCADRLYQKEAIKNAIIYLFSGRYASIEKLVEENYKINPELRERYKTLNDYYKRIQLPQILSATTDLATGTGKSYVIFGIAQIALGLGLIDKVLVLCPSLTIEKGLTEKFNELNSNSVLANAIPENAKWKNPNIIDGNSTIKDGDICIENIHAVYSKTGSSIQDSLGFGKGERCMVLSDEVHHAYNNIDGNTEDAKAIKKWKEFLINNSCGFRYLLGFTGTAYIENEYFNDVIYRYSLRNAIENRIVKRVEYKVKDEIQNEENIKYQKIYQNHQYNKAIYHKIKPLTLLVTKDIRLAKQTKDILCEFLSQQEGIPYEDISQNKVLIVTSAKEHEVNVNVHLPSIDQKNNSFEWIVSVSMLTEGWDVKNVCQIVPMEERAFNSKLLIAQVLGRGLRLPLAYPNAQVIVFNHDNWSKNIKILVDEILEIENTITSSTLSEGDRAQYHFTLYNIDYERHETLIPTQETQVFDYTKELIRLQSQTPEFTTTVEYENVFGETTTREYKVRKETEAVQKVVNKIYEEFRSRKFEGVALKLKDGEYTTNSIPKETIERIIRNSMSEAKIDGNELTKVNKQTIFSAFNTLLRKKPKSITFVRKAKPYFEIETKVRGNESISIGNLRRDTSVFYTDDYATEIVNEETKNNFSELKDDRDFRGAFMLENPHLFKTPVDIIFTSSRPEEDFVKNLCKQENAENITAWIKSRNQSFYQIEYSLTREDSTHTKKQQKFNPDFFITVKKDEFEYVIVIEIKADGDDSDENKAKYKYAKQHFADLNKILKEANVKQEYIFHFLSPCNYTEFFDHLQNGKLIRNEFVSELDNLLYC